MASISKQSLLRAPPKQALTTGWRDPFVSRWASLSTMLEVDPSTEYMMLSSGERGRGPQLHLYQSSNLLDWKSVSTILDVKVGAQISRTSDLRFGRNFECASFFSIGDRHYIIVGVEEDVLSTRHNKHYPLWLCGSLILENGKPKFNIVSHGLLDHGVLYAPHTFRDADDQLLQLGWADEAAQPEVVRKQGWAGCLTHPRELYQISRPVTGLGREQDIWDIDERTGMMTTLGIRPAPQLRSLRNNHQHFTSLERFRAIHGTNYEVKAKFSCLSGNEKFGFNVQESLNSVETTKIVFDLEGKCIKVDRTHSSLENLGASSPDSGDFYLLPGEDLEIRIFVDDSILEVYANDRFALSSRIYPSLETSDGASYDFGNFDERNVMFECWFGLKNAWPGRKANENVIEEMPRLTDVKDLMSTIDPGELVMQPAVYV